MRVRRSGEPGWLAWELQNVRPFDAAHPVPARLRLYTLSLEAE